MKRVVTVLISTFCFVLSMSAQDDRREVRRGNADYRRSNYKEAELDYRKALVQDSLSVAGAYNLANTLYQQHDYQGAKNTYEGLAKTIDGNKDAARYYYNKGNNDLQLKDYRSAVEDFKQSLLLNPGDISAKESYIYAKKMLENGQQGDQGDPGDKGDQGDKDKQDQPEQDQPEQNQGDQNQQQQQQQDRQQISRQQAQQLLKAVQEKEKETQEKVEKVKAAQAGNRQKEKNW